MIRERERQVRYYERFQVEDVLTFFTGQLIQARSPDGARVLLQEIKLLKPLPPGAGEMLKQLQHPQMLSVLDVIVEKDVVVLVHPIFSGEPLPLVVDKNNPMEPAQALRLYRKLIKTMVDLAKFPIPLWTTLDPRNVCLYGDEPFVLFCGLNRYTPKPRNDQKQDLLYYLLAGEHPRNVQYSGQDLSKRIKQVPVAIREFAVELLNDTYTLEQILEKADKILQDLPESNEKKGFKKLNQKRTVPLAVVTVMLVLAGGAIGYSAYGQWFPNSAKPLDKDGKENGSKQVIRFTKDRMETHVLAPEMDDSSAIRGSLQQTELNSFLVQLRSNTSAYTYGIRTDSKGRLELFQKGDGQAYTVKQQDPSFRIKEGKAYHIQLYYIEGEPLRVSVKDSDSDQKWVAVGTVPLDSDLRVEVKGLQGTEFQSPKISSITEGEEAKQSWMAPHPWNLVFGEGTIGKKSIILNGQSLLRSHRGNISFFTFRRNGEDSKEPLHMELEGADGSRYVFLWEEKDKLSLYQDVQGGDLLTEKRLDWSFQEEQDTEVSILTSLNQLTIRISQNSNQSSLEYTHDQLIDIQSISIKSDSDLELLNP
ncbi:hypothetical protein GXN76_06690 [Kroppenstedtia pulmonis]|uniref:Uncharacterized protein n=1 Tax=Kroppenstedtia pulmonis TaxID=1380685 RepID=A0A7D4BPM1_9BACL|nr:hypothetical protein [Kroppenstedtia pulmonis]QKG84191.1 hypothetical protein GXN76_06690 [Kroppenstedtia pulmonis]